MTQPVLPIDPETLLISADAAREAARAHAEAYRTAQPYPHGGFDNFLPPEILERVLQELRDLPEAETSFNREQERLKSSYLPERLGTYTKNLFYALNSRPFLMFLEELTGISGLIPAHTSRAAASTGSRRGGIWTSMPTSTTTAS